MRSALRSLSVQGVITNREFLLEVLDQPDFVAGNFNTHFIDQHMSEALDASIDEAVEGRAAVIAALAAQQRRDRERTILPSLASGWRNNFHTPQWQEYGIGERSRRVEYRHLGDQVFTVSTLGEEAEARIVSWDEPRLTFELDGHRTTARVTFHADRVYVHERGVDVALTVKPRFPDKSSAVPAGGCVAPMPGKIIEIRVAEGDAVSQGQTLLIMEAMKMEHSVTAPRDGTVERVSVRAGDQVDADALLAVVSDA
jgi:acetyl/propionyl-CoA carboxylase alpha subunit